MWAKLIARSDVFERHSMEYACVLSYQVHMWLCDPIVVTCDVTSQVNLGQSASPFCISWTPGRIEMVQTSFGLTCDRDLRTLPIWPFAWPVTSQKGQNRSNPSKIGFRGIWAKLIVRSDGLERYSMIYACDTHIKLCNPFIVAYDVTRQVNLGQSASPFCISCTPHRIEMVQTLLGLTRDRDLRTLLT